MQNFVKRFISKVWMMEITNKIEYYGKYFFEKDYGINVEYA